jgi:hypothetical protein
MKITRIVLVAALLVAAAFGAVAPQVTGSCINYRAHTLTLVGDYFAHTVELVDGKPVFTGAPSVEWGSTELQILAYTETSVLVSLPAQRPGSYVVTISNGDQTTFTVLYEVSGRQHEKCERNTNPCGVFHSR